MNLFNYFIKLYKEKRQIALLSYFYGSVAVVFVFIAGLCALINQSFGVGVLIVPLVAAIALCANITVWALIRIIVEAMESFKKDVKVSIVDTSDEQEETPVVKKKASKKAAVKSSSKKPAKKSK